MPRQFRPDTCLICDEVPCICNRKVVTPKPARVPKESKQKVPSDLERMKERAARRKIDTSSDTEFASALNALMPLLHPDELEKYRGQITASPATRPASLTTRIEDWKGRRREAS